MRNRTYAVNHPNLIVATLESFRETNQMTVARHCNITRINQRTYEAWLSGRRSPEQDNIRWVTVQDADGETIGVLQRLDTYNCPRTGKRRYYAVVFNRSGAQLDVGAGGTPFDAVVNGAQKAAGKQPGTHNSAFKVTFVPGYFK